MDEPRCDTRDVKFPAGHFHGENLAYQVLASLRLMENDYPKNLRLARHSHACACFSLLLRGGYTESYGSRSLDWRPMTVGFNPPEEPHSSRIDVAGARFFIIELSADWLERARSQSIPLVASATFRKGALTWLGLKLYQEFRRPDEVSGLVVEATVLEMMAEYTRKDFGRQTGRLPSWLRHAEDLIRSRFADPLTLSEIARASDVHPVHLARVFRRRHRCTVGDYVRRLRVESAATRLERSDDSLRDIAIGVGFADQSHFARTFKRQTGLTPGEYRRIRRAR
jgi:AraC family transcriptional regulator